MITLAPPTRNKPYRILFEHKPRYLYVMIQCETSNYAIAKKYWGEILAIQEHRGYDRVLIEKDVTNPMPMSDVVLLVSELAHSGCHDVKFAVYDHNYNAERSGFEEMASNGGQRHCRRPPVSNRPADSTRTAWLRASHARGLRVRGDHRGRRRRCAEGVLAAPIARRAGQPLLAISGCRACCTITSWLMRARRRRS